MDNYYVYVLLDTTKIGIYKYEDIVFENEPFYVGKGKNNRVYQSKSNKIKRIKNIEKSEIINNIHFNDLTVKSIKYIENVDEDTALGIESILIKKIGRSDKSNGPLVNKSNGGEGKSGGTSRIGDWPELYKPVLKYSISGEYICEYVSIKEALEKNPKSYNISYCCRGKRETSGGYIWRFKDSSNFLPVIDLTHRTQNGNIPVPVLSLDTNDNITGKYNSVKEASIATGCSSSKIVLVCQNKRKTTKGHRFIYDSK